MAQARADKQYVLNIIDNATRIDVQGQNRDHVLQILQREAARRPRVRGGPTKRELLLLQPLAGNNFQHGPQSSKAEVTDELIVQLQQNDVNPNAGAVAAVVPAVVAGWEQFFDGVQPAQPVKALLEIRRGNFDENPVVRVDALLKEIESARKAEQEADADYLTYVKGNLQEMSRHPAPLPDGAPNEAVWFIYKQVLQKELDATMQEAAPASRAQVPRSNRRPIEVSSGTDSVSESTSDSDLDSYMAAGKRFARSPRRKKRKRAKKRKKSKKKKRGRKSKRRRRSRSGSSSSSSNSSTEESAEEEKPNGARVSSSAYDDTHLERLQEFRQEYKDWYDGEKQSGWPPQEALKFISKKFARKGAKFADEDKGVKRAFGNDRKEKELARKRTVRIYDMGDEIAHLRQERHDKMSEFARRIKGASRAAKKVAQRKARKFKAKSVQVEQQLVARVGVLCDLVLLGSESWNAYHAQLQLGGQREAIIESTGGDVSKSVAAKAWKEAEKRAFKQATPRPTPPFLAGKRGEQTGTGRKGLGTFDTKKPCYWCNKVGHLGRECADKKAGKPCHPKARATKWPAKDRQKVLEGKKE